MPSPRHRLITRIRSAVAVAALLLALAGTPDPASASPSEWPSASSATLTQVSAGLAGLADVRGSMSDGIHLTARASDGVRPADQVRPTHQLHPAHPAHQVRPADNEVGTGDSAGTWAWPVAGAHDVIRGFEAPATRYSAGHRGIDIRAGTGTRLSAPIGGTVRFAGIVVDRATVTIETADNILVSMEPVTTDLVAGDTLTRGAPIGTVSTGGHCSLRCFHLGVRVDGEYVSPMLFFGGVPRAVLLPIE